MTEQPASTPPAAAEASPPKTKKRKSVLKGTKATGLGNLLSVSTLSSLAALYYLYVAFSNLANLMHPLRGLGRDVLEGTADERRVYPLWDDAEDAALGLRVYLSSEPTFSLDFLAENDRFGGGGGGDGGGVVRDGTSFLLWAEDDARTATATFPSRSFVLAARDDDDDDASSLAVGACDAGTCSAEERQAHTSLERARQWLKDAVEHERQLQEDGGGLMAAMNSAGGGIESTSVLLSLYTKLQRGAGRLLGSVAGAAAGGERPATEEAGDGTGREGEDRAEEEPTSVVRVSPHNPLWQSLLNGTAYVHVVLARQVPSADHQPRLLSAAPDPRAAGRRLRQLHAQSNVLFGQVNMVKRELPLHVPSPKRLLYRDLLFLWKQYVACAVSKDAACDALVPPWDMAHHQARAHEEYQLARQHKKQGVEYPYWKPEVSVHLIHDDEGYPLEVSHRVGFEVVPLSPAAPRRGGGRHASGRAYLPAVHVDEIGLTSDKYVPLNGTVTALPLRIGFRDGGAAGAAAGAGAGGREGLTPARYRLLTHLASSLESQADMGFEQSDIDDLRRLIAETNVVLLAVTILASVFHLLFEFLTFKSDVEFWRGNTDLTGLSVRALFLDWFSQVVILLYLVEMDSSLLMTIPTACGMLIALWKCQRGAGLKFVKSSNMQHSNERRVWYNKIFVMFGYELRATRLRSASPASNGPSQAASDKPDLAALTEEMDQLATRLLGKFFLLPLVLCFGVYSLAREPHSGWYSWFITTASSFVYAIGFVLMTPQLFLNFKLKSVAHLPWRVLGYRFVNTFIDDLFAFIIRMPTMARVSCFRDDVVFIVYLWQRYLYPVDASRPVEGGGTGDAAAVPAEARGGNKGGKGKKKQS